MKTRRSKMIRAGAVFATAAIVTLLAGCAGESTPAPTGGAGDAAELDLSVLGVSEEATAQMAELYEEAVAAGGKLAIYGTNHENVKPLYNAFTEIFDKISIETFQQTSSEQISILESERVSGNYVASVLQNPNALRYVDQGFIESYEPFTFHELPGVTDAQKDTLHGDGFSYTTPMFSFFGLGVNTDLMDPADAPTSWQELTDPKWDGKLVLHDPTVPGGGQAIMQRLYEAGVVDEKWLETIADYASLKGEYASSVMSLVQGEFPLLVAGAGADLEGRAASGAPVKFLTLEKDNVGLADKWMLLKGAPNEAAGKLLLNFLYTKPGQQAIAESNNLAVSSEAVSPLGWPTYEEANLAAIPSEKELNERYAAVSEMLTRIFR